MLPGVDELRITEERSDIGAQVPARGSWPPAGATVELHLLKRAVGFVSGETVDLHALDDAVVVFDNRWHVRLNLLPFGPEGRRSAPDVATPALSRHGTAPLADLPLFRWARRLHPKQPGVTHP